MWWGEEKVENAGFWGLKCCHLESGFSFVPYVPSVVFFVDFLLAYYQFSSYAFPNRTRVSTAFKWILLGLFLTHALAIWQKTITIVSLLVNSHMKSEPSVWLIPSFNLAVHLYYAELVKFYILLGLSVAFFAGNLVFYRRGQNRYVWLNVRRRNRTEMGTSRYYLSRPCSYFETPMIRPRILRSRSGEAVRNSRLPLIKSKTA